MYRTVLSRLLRCAVIAEAAQGLDTYTAIDCTHTKANDGELVLQRCKFQRMNSRMEVQYCMAHYVCASIVHTLYSTYYSRVHFRPLSANGYLHKYPMGSTGGR